MITLNSYKNIKKYFPLKTFFTINRNNLSCFDKILPKLFKIFNIIQKVYILNLKIFLPDYENIKF